MMAVLLLMMTVTMSNACQQILSPQHSYSSWALTQLSLNEPDEVDHFHPHLTDGKPRQRKLESFAPDDGHNCVKPGIQSRISCRFQARDVYSHVLPDEWSRGRQEGLQGSEGEQITPVGQWARRE